jgi:thioredoxin 1
MLPDSNVPETFCEIMGAYLFARNWNSLHNRINKTAEERGMSEVMELNDDTFKETIKTGVTLVDFWAPWCAPCRIQGPIVQGVAEKTAEKAKIAKVNVDESQQAANELMIRAIPTLFLFKDGKAVRQFVGVTQESVLIEAIEAAL